MKPFIVANWKMNPSSQREARMLFAAVNQGTRRIRSVDVVVAPPLPYLSLARSFIRPRFWLGAQNTATEERGAYTGEVSASMLRDLDVRFVIVGHSERRRLFGESDEIINRKIKIAMKAGLTIILAIGEETPDAEDVVPRILQDQLTHGLQGIPKRNLRHLVVAYEPVWAISTTPGARVDTPDNATRRAIYIRKILTKLIGASAAQKIRILYGGSVTSKNAASFIASDIRAMDGLLVGGASMKAHEFVKIVHSVARARKSKQH